MNSDPARIKRRVDPRRLLTALGIEYEDHDFVLRAQCPNPKHDDHSPSWDIGADHECVEGDEGTRLWYGYHRCLSCEYTGDAITLVQTVRACEFHDAVEWLRREFSAEKERTRADDEYLLARAWGVEHVSVVGMPSHALPIWEHSHSRRWCDVAGIPEWQAKRHDLRWWRGCPMFPVYDVRGRLVDYETRGLGGVKSRSAKGGDHRTPWGGPHLEPGADTIILVEGFFEFLRLERMGYHGRVLALRGSRIFGEVLERYVATARTVIVLPDVDAAGERLWEQARTELRYSADGTHRRVLCAWLPCASCEGADDCDRDADACTDDAHIERALLMATERATLIGEDDDSGTYEVRRAT